MKLFITATVAVLSCCAYLSAEPIVVTSSRIPKQSLGSITTITSEEIEVSKETSVLSLLQRVPGVEVVQNGGAGSVSTVFVRGANSNQTLVLIDGVRANDNTSGLFDFANLNTLNVERIEVVRGAQSVLYGSEAIGGVINIITKKNTTSEFSVQGGSFGFVELRANSGFSSDTYRAGFGFSAERQDGFSAASAGEEKDGFSQFAISSALESDFLESTLRYYSGEVEVDGFDFITGPVDDLNFEQDSRLFSVNNKIFLPLGIDLQIGFNSQQIEGSDPDTEFNNFKIKSDTFNISPVRVFDLDTLGELVSGYSYERRDGKNSGSFDETRETNAFFLEHQIGESVALNNGLRYELNSDFENQFTYRSNLSAGSEVVRVFATFSTGFRAPAFNELAFPGFGNAELGAEESRSFELGATFNNEHFTTGAALFRNDFDNLITSDPVTFQAVNIAEASAYGIETWVSAYFFNANYTYTNSEDESTGEVLPRRPRHQATLSFRGNLLEKLEGELVLHIVNNRKDVDLVKMDNYERVDAVGTYHISDGASVFVRVRNLFDQDYEETNGFQAAGISVYSGLNLKML